MSNPTEELTGATSPKRRIKVGIVGCGEVAQIMHWPSLYQLVDQFEVTALCDVSPLILEKLGKLWNVRTLTTNHRELMARNDVDAVYGNEKVVRIQYDTPYVRNLPIRLFVTEDNGRGGVTNVNSHPVWGDPFVAEWKTFYENVTENKAAKTSPADFAQDLELFAEMARLMRGET